METTEQTAQPGPRPAIVWTVVLAAAFVVRFPTLGLQSPWLDEINNWLTASEIGFRIQPRAHTLTYLSERIGLAISDSTWGLRLSSAVIGFLAVVAVTQFLLSRVGSRAALIGGVLFALLPFSIHYSQDANHYAPMMLSGILSALAVAWFLDRPDPKPALAAAALAVSAVSIGFHPVGLLPFAGGCACLFIWLVVHADILPFKSIPALAKRVAMIAAALGAIAFVLMQEPVRRHLQLGNFAQVEGTRTPGLNWPFWSALLADLLSTPFIHSPVDVLVGVLGAALALGGWCASWRAGLRWAAVGVALVTFATIVPFMVFELGHFFYPKFYAPAVPLLAIGICMAMETALRARIRSPWRIIAGPAWAVWICLLAARGWTWQWSRIELNQQPTYQLLAAIRDKTPDGIVVATKNNYSSRALGFLWHRTNMGNRRHVALTADELGAGPAIQQLEEIAFESERPPLFTSLLESREHYAPDFDAYLAQSTKIVAHLPSSAPDDFVPFDRSLTVRMVAKPARDPFLLPRAGAHMSSILDEFRARAVYDDGGVAMSLPLGTGARYRFRVAGAAAALALDYRWDSAGKRPDVLLIAVDGERVFAVGCDGLEPSGSLRVPVEVASSELHTFDVMLVNMNQDWPSERPAGFVPTRLRAATELDTIAAPEAEFLAAEDRPTPTRETLAPGVQNAELPAGKMDLPQVAAGDTLVAIAPFEVGGLPNLGAAPVLDIGGQRVGLWRVLAWTQGPVMTGAIFKAKSPAAKADILTYIRPRLHGQEQDPWYARGGVRVYRVRVSGEKKG